MSRNFFPRFYYSCSQMKTTLKMFVCRCSLFVIVTHFLASVASEASDVQIEVLNAIDDCKLKTQENNFITIHFKSKWKGGNDIANTYERGVPIEIQLGTKMLAPGLDTALTGMCIGEKRKITMPATLGWLDKGDGKENETKDIEYEVELVEINHQTTLNTFKYLDLNDDKKISQQEAETLVKMFMKALTTEIPGVDVKYLVTFFMSLHDRDEDMHISEKEFLDSTNSFTNWGKEEL